MSSVVVLCGGVGAARFLVGLSAAIDPSGITAVVNTADDIVLHGLHVSPDLDTCTYTVAGAINPETSWGLVDETWNAMDTLARYGHKAWFNLGDRDLGTHLFRTQRLSEGASLSTVTGEIARAWDIDMTILPVTDDAMATMVTTVDEGEVGFQDYFVRRKHDVAVTAVRFDGAEATTPAPGVLEAIATADAIVIAPSNPIVSIGPLLAVPGIVDALRERRDAVVAVSPIIAGAALKGPADRMMTELGHEPSVVGVSELYSPFAGALVIDTADADRCDEIAAHGLRPVVCDTIMSTPEIVRTLAETTIGAVTDGSTA